jgi:prolyl-tRNA editing enzyme YbaK/EbsC (Cys-tRNA(Pro) deacylase)
MYVSGGKIGVQLRLKPADLLLAAKAEYAELLMEHGNEGN